MLTIDAVEMAVLNKSPRQLDLIARWQERQPVEVVLHPMSDIAMRFGVSVSCIGKRIKALRESGTEIGLLVYAKAGCDIYLYSEKDIEIIEDLLYIANHKRKRSDVPSVY